MCVSRLVLRTFTLVLFGALALGTVAAAQTPSSVWTIPGTVNAGGLNNTRFVSDLAVTNPGSTPALATISFIPANGTTPKQVTLNAGQTVVYRNVLDSLWGAQGAGATQVASDLPLLIRARTYNTASSGTYGVALPVFADDRLLNLGDTADSLWISQSADGSSGYRTNVAVVFPDDGGGSATVTIYDADGGKLASQDYSLDAPGFQQFGVGSFAGAVPLGRAEVVVTSGRAAGYSVVVDNVTGDSSLFTFEDLPAGFQDVLVNGVARRNGANNTFFRTDGRFYNPGSTDATVSVAFHASQNTNSAPLTGTFTVPAGKIRDVVDVLDSLLGLPVGSAGALRFKSDASVAILCRTSNVDPLGVKPGTFGAQQKPRQLLSFLMSADAGAVVTGIRQNATFRTNVGFAAGADGSDYALTLKSASGATVATATGSLGAFGWTQPNVADLFPGTTVPDDATLLVRVTSGSVDVFDSSIDNASGDPVVTPIMPLPAEIPSSATIGPAGGSVRSVDGVLTLKIPAGALSVPVAIGLAQAPNDAPKGIGPGYDISPDGLAFAKPALLSLRYGPGGLDVPEIDGIALAFPVGATWAGLTGGRIETSARTLTIGLPNTSPSPPKSLTAGRVTHANPGASRIVAVQGIEIVIAGTWVPTDGEKMLTPIFHLQPSGTGEESASALISELNLDPKDVTVFPPEIGTISRFDIDKYTYKAPHSIGHASLPVKIRMKVLVTNSKPYETSASLHVVRRKWNLSVEFKLDLQCLGGNEDFGYSYSDAQSQNFLLDADLSLNAEPTLGTLPADAVVKNCKCTATMLGQPGTITFPGVGGKLFTLPSPMFQMVGKAEILNMIPSIQRTCPCPWCVPPQTTFTYPPDDPSDSFTFEIIQLVFVGGLRPSDGTPRWIILEPPVLTIITEWHSIKE
jgi:hypothetical protein